MPTPLLTRRSALSEHLEPLYLANLTAAAAAKLRR